jgi:hypothetical protein
MVCVLKVTEFADKSGLEKKVFMGSQFVWRKAAFRRRCLTIIIDASYEHGCVTGSALLC